MTSSALAQRVLILDRDPDARMLLRFALEGSPDFSVVAEATDAAEAAELAAQCRPDVVLVDYRLGSAPFEAVAGMRRAAPEAQLILVSAHSTAELRLAARALGAVGWLSRETPVRRIAEELAELVGVLGRAQRALGAARTRLSADPSSPRLARGFVDQAMVDWDPSTKANDVIALLVSELVTNAVLHAGSEVELLVHLTEECARIEVGDASPAEAAVAHRGTAATSGRGIALVEALARRWGSHPRPGGGKVIWFEVDRPSPD